VVGPIRCYGTLYHDSDDPLEAGSRVHAIERPPRKALNGSTHSILPVVALDYGRMVLQARQSRWMSWKEALAMIHVQCTRHAFALHDNASTEHRLGWPIR
jgi:hypothetical protein